MTWVAKKLRASGGDVGESGEMGVGVLKGFKDLVERDVDVKRSGLVVAVARG